MYTTGFGVGPRATSLIHRSPSESCNTHIGMQSHGTRWADVTRWYFKYFAAFPTYFEVCVMLVSVFMPTVGNTVIGVGQCDKKWQSQPSVIPPEKTRSRSRSPCVSGTKLSAK